MQKRGLSMVVSVMIIILLVIVAIGIVWFVVRNVLVGGSEGVTLGRFLIDLDITNAIIDESDAEMVYVSVSRGSGEGVLLGIKFIFSDGDTSEVAEELTTLEQLGKKTFSFNIGDDDLGIPDANEVSIAPIYESTQGNELTGEIVDTATLGTGTPAGGSGGEPPTPPTETCNGTRVDIELGEECDGGVGCIDCLCDEDYIPAEPPELYCNPEPGASCGNEIVEPEFYEECELGGIGCGQSCLCEDGYVPFSPEQLNCDYAPAVVEGLVEFIWPPGAVMYFDSISLPWIAAAGNLSSGQYVNFTGVETGNCIKIVSIIYSPNLPTYNKTHVKLERVVSISTDDDFTIWKVDDCAGLI